VEGVNGDLEDHKGLKKDLRCIKCEVRKLKMRPAVPPTVQEPDVTLEPSKVADLREDVADTGTVRH
jgi:hypothetical protein